MSAKSCRSASGCVRELQHPDNREEIWFRDGYDKCLSDINSYLVTTEDSIGFTRSMLHELSKRLNENGRFCNSSHKSSAREMPRQMGCGCANKPSFHGINRNHVNRGFQNCGAFQSYPVAPEQPLPYPRTSNLRQVSNSTVRECSSYLYNPRDNSNPLNLTRSPKRIVQSQGDNLPRNSKDFSGINDASVMEISKPNNVLETGSKSNNLQLSSVSTVIFDHSKCPENCDNTVFCVEEAKADSTINTLLSYDSSLCRSQCSVEPDVDVCVEKDQTNASDPFNFCGDAGDAGAGSTCARTDMKSVCVNESSDHMNQDGTETSKNELNDESVIQSFRKFLSEKAEFKTPLSPNYFAPKTPECFNKSSHVTTPFPFPGSPGGGAIRNKDFKVAIGTPYK